MVPPPGTALSPRIDFWSAMTLEHYLGADWPPSALPLQGFHLSPQDWKLVMQKARCCSDDLAGADPSAAVPLTALNNSVSLTQACSGLGSGEIASWNSAQNSVPTWQAAGPHLRMSFRG